MADIAVDNTLVLNDSPVKGRGVAMVAIQAGDAVIKLTDGCYLADANGTGGKNACSGIALEDYDIGDICEYQKEGIVNFNQSIFTKGVPIFLSVTAGALADAAPAVAATVVFIGVPASASSLKLGIMNSDITFDA